jgi:hypothetical protein
MRRAAMMAAALLVGFFATPAGASAPRVRDGLGRDGLGGDGLEMHDGLETHRWNGTKSAFADWDLGDRAHDVDLTALREAYFAAVGDAGAIPRGLGEIERIRGGGGVVAGSELDATLTAYRGALVTLQAKHAAWPPRKLTYMREGLRLLDGAVAASPDAAEARSLRLMSCYYLPGFFGRRGSVREDFAALARLLPQVRARYPAELYGAIARFVVEKGRLDAGERRALEATLAPDG